MSKILLIVKTWWIFRAAAAGISHEQVWIQHLPQGDFAVASYETNDPEQSFKILAA